MGGEPGREAAGLPQNGRDDEIRDQLGHCSSQGIRCVWRRARGRFVWSVSEAWTLARRETGEKSSALGRERGGEPTCASVLRWSRLAP
jgi:hypothetical protein